MFSTKGRYALRVMVDLAEHKDEGYISLTKIAERQGISKKYLEIIMRKLMLGNMVLSIGGRNGGYSLCREPEEYNICEILELTEGPIATVACLMCNALPCNREAICKTRPMWIEFNNMTHDYFSKKTLKDLMQGN